MTALGLAVDIPVECQARIRRLPSQRPSRGIGQAPYGAAALRIPECVAHGAQVVTAHVLGERVGGRVLKVVGLVEDQVLGMLEPFVVRHDESVVEYGHVGVAQPVPGPAMEIQFVQAGHGRAGRILNAQHSAEATEGSAPGVESASAQIVPIPRRSLGHPAAHHGQGERLVWAEPIWILG